MIIGTAAALPGAEVMNAIWLGGTLEPACFICTHVHAHATRSNNIDYAVLSAAASLHSQLSILANMRKLCMTALNSPCTEMVVSCASRLCVHAHTLCACPYSVCMPTHPALHVMLALLSSRARVGITGEGEVEERSGGKFKAGQGAARPAPGEGHSHDPNTAQVCLLLLLPSLQFIIESSWLLS